MTPTGALLRPKGRERVLVQRTDDSVVLLDLDTGTYYALEEVGARVWELCDGTRLVPEVVEVIVAEYDAPLAVVEADVGELLGELLANRLIADSI